MLRFLRMTLPLLLALAILAAAGQAGAHVPAPPPPATTFEAPEAPAIIPVLSAAPMPPALPWHLFAALGVATVIAWRRPRRVLVPTLVLLLCVFAFENALHSVHHGLDPQQQRACTVAAASAHLAAVQVDDPGLSSVMLPVVGAADVASTVLASTRFLSPDQGRAPPSAIL
jgi:hypothetical protein